MDLQESPLSFAPLLVASPIRLLTASYSRKAFVVSRISRCNALNPFTASLTSVSTFTYKLLTSFVLNVTLFVLISTRLSFAMNIVSISFILSLIVRQLNAQHKKEADYKPAPFRNLFHTP